MRRQLCCALLLAPPLLLVFLGPAIIRNSRTAVIQVYTEEASAAVPVFAAVSAPVSVPVFTAAPTPAPEPEEDIPQEPEEDILGFEGISKEERLKCMHDKAPRPFGPLSTFLGTTLPSKVEVDSLNNTKRLKGAICDSKKADNKGGGCGLFHFKHPNPEEYTECIREVPRLIHFIWLDKPLPEKYANNIMQVMRVNPDWQVLLWVNEKAINTSNLIEGMDRDTRMKWPKVHIKHLWENQDIFENWDVILQEPNVGARSDWIRLEVVYRYGGMYMDTDAKPNHPFSSYGGIFRWPFVAYSDPEGYGNLCNCIFSAEKRSPLMRLAARGWREAFHHHRVPSGPPFGCGILTSAFMTYNNPEMLMFAQWYIFKPKRDRSIDPVFSMTFDGSWIPKGMYGRK